MMGNQLTPRTPLPTIYTSNILVVNTFLPTLWDYPEFPGYAVDLPYGSHEFKTPLISSKLLYYTEHLQVWKSDKHLC